MVFPYASKNNSWMNVRRIIVRKDLKKTEFTVDAKLGLLSPRHLLTSGQFWRFYLFWVKTLDSIY